VAKSPTNEQNSQLPSAQNSSSESRRRRIKSSAALAAYGDALGFISELTDRAGLQRRVGKPSLTTTVPWKRRVGGQFGVMAELPAGAISDDTQLRLATSRSVRPDGRFDVETFAELELPVWPSYALGAGRGSLAAAAALRKRDVTWATNFFSAKGTDYLQGGGNGAAMRIQPHVWAANPAAGPLGWMPDVVTNAVCTHGHARGIAGAVFHAACLDYALHEERVPGPEHWVAFIDALPGIAAVAHDDGRLAELWLGQWQKRAKQSLEEALDQVKSEMRDDAEKCARLRVGGRGSYAEAVEEVKAFDPAQRGSGTKTALLAAVAAWLYAQEPEAALLTCVNQVGTDTDSIATMAGAILGGAVETPMPGPVQDLDYILLEADRMWAASAGLSSPGFPYPDLLGWKAPRTGTDAVVVEDKQLHLAGLGAAGVQGQAAAGSGKSSGVWQWVQLWFGQSVFAKRRERPPKLVESQRVDPLPGYGHIGAETNGQRDTAPVSRRQGASLAQPPLRAVRGTRRTVDQLTSDVISSGFDDAVLAAAFRELALRETAIEESIAFTSIVVKALRARASRS
jgi:ADP-ribosylglycohydrolase